MIAQLLVHIGWHRYSTSCAVVLALAYVMLLLLANGLLVVEMNFNVSVNDRAESLSTHGLGGGWVTQNLLASLSQLHATWAFWPLQLVLLGYSALLCITRHVTALLLCVAMVVAVVVLYQSVGEASLLRYGVFATVVLYLTSTFVQIVCAMRVRHQLADAFEQFVPPEVARQVVDDPGTLDNAESVRELTVLFCDVRGFTGIAEQLTPSQLTGLLNRYFDVVTRVVIRHRGTIDKYMGDAVMAFWGAPVASREHAALAVRAARDIQAEMDSLARDFQLAQLPPIKVGIGVSTGESFVGHLGSSHRKAYTVIGDSVNVAQRLEKATREYRVDVIVSEATVEQDRETAYRELGTLRLKGRERALRVYQPVGRRDQLSHALREELSQHEQAMALLRTRQWQAAKPLVMQLAENSAEKALYRTYLAHVIDALRPDPENRKSA